MRANNFHLGHDVNRLIFSKLSLADLYQLMLTNKQKEIEVNQYLKFVLSNAYNFFARLTDPQLITNLDNALMMHGLYHTRLGTSENSIKIKLENDGQFITALFDKYLHSGMALSLIANAISRIANADKLRELWLKKQLCDTYYALLTSNVAEIQNLKEIHDALTSTPLKHCFKLILNIQTIQRSWSENNCFPVNLSGRHILAAKNIGDASFSVLKNMKCSERLNDRLNEIRLAGADLSYDHKNGGNLEFNKCDLRYAKMIGNPDVNYAFSKCELQFTIIKNHSIGVEDISECKLEKAVIAAITYKLQSTFDPEQQSAMFKALLKFSFDQCRIQMSIPMYYDRDEKEPLQYVKNKLLKLLDKMIYDSNNLEELCEFSTILATPCHILQLRRIKYKEASTDLLDKSYFSKDTNSWKSFLYKLKNRAVILMEIASRNYYDKLSLRANQFLLQLIQESGRPGFFDKSDEIYKKVYESYVSGLVPIKNPISPSDRN